MSFSDDIKHFKKTTQENAEKILRGTFLSLASKIIIRTPVDTGRARSNWQTGVNAIPQGEISGNESAAVSNAANVRFKLGDELYLINNLPYIGKLENGSSTQAPAGMVRVTVAEFHRTVDREASKLK